MLSMAHGVLGISSHLTPSSDRARAAKLLRARYHWSWTDLRWCTLWKHQRACERYGELTTLTRFVRQAKTLCYCWTSGIL